MQLSTTISGGAVRAPFKAALILLALGCSPAAAAEPAGARPMQINISYRVLSAGPGLSFGPSAMVGAGSCSATCCAEGYCASGTVRTAGGYYPGQCVNINAICSAVASSYSGGVVSCSCSCNLPCSDTGGPTSNLAGNGITTGVGGLGNDFGTTRLAGPDQGQPTFTQHASRSNEGWLKEKEKQGRLRAARAVLTRQTSSGCRAPAGNVRYVMSPCQASALQKKAGLEKAYAWISTKLPGGLTTEVQSPIGDLRLNPTPATTADYESRYLNAIPAGEGLALGGAGITQGAPDKLPPPSPTGPELDRGGGNVRCPKDHPFYNDKSGSCFVAAEQCGKDTSRGKASCQDKSAPLPPVSQPLKQPPQAPSAPAAGASAPAREAALDSRGQLKCRKAWWLNPDDNNCYPDEGACKAASGPAKAPACSQTNP